MIKEGFVLRNLAEMNLIMPTGDNVKDFNGALMLNEIGAFIFSELKSGRTIDEIAELLTKEYVVPFEKAKTDIIKTIDILKEARIAE